MAKEDSGLYKAGRVLLKYRTPVLATIILLTIVFGYFASTVSLRPP